MPRVVFTPSGLTAEVEVGVTVLDAARSLGVDLDSVCGGRGICGRCQVALSAGSFAKWGIESSAAALSGPSETEAAYKGRRGLEDRRLGCAARVEGDVVIDVPPDSQVHRQVVRKQLALDDVVLDPLFTLFYVEVSKAVLGDSGSVHDTLIDALNTQHRVSVTAIAPRLLATLHRAVLDGNATVAVRDDAIVSVWPGFVDTAYGVAVDIGSTTIAGHLIDLFTGEVVASSGRMNPQIRFGEDLMSRVSYVMMNPGGERELTAAVRTALRELIGELLDHADVAADAVLDVVLVGNPIMHHLLLGIDPTPLGQAPFTLATAMAVNTTADALDLGLTNASAYVGPCIAGHVGADTAAAILAEGPHRGDDWQLLVDVGTNAEIVLGCRDRQFAASSPTGPAFEGAQISSGQRATAGAIERVRVDRLTLEPRVKVIGSDLWSDDPSFNAETEELTISGVCGSGIIEAMGELFLAGVIDADGVVDGSLAERSPRVVADGRTFSYVLFERGDIQLTVTQNDVRAIQLAKAALRAGIDLLIEHAGIERVNDVRLAGAFGAHIDPLYTLVLGLVPDCPLQGVRSVGNAAGVGAARALLSRSLRTEMETTAQHVTENRNGNRTSLSGALRAVDGIPTQDRAGPEPRAARRAARAPPERSNRSPSSAPDRGFIVTDVRSRRSGGRAGRQALRASHAVEAATYLTRTMKPYELVSDEGLELLEHNADTILAEVGVEIRDYPSALALFANAGADVSGTRARFPRGLCRSIVQATAPAMYTQHGRNAERSVQMGGNATVFAPNYGSPFVHDVENGRRYATLDDFQNFVKLAYMSPYLHHSGGTVCEPVDVPVSKRHLDMVYSHLKYSDKPFMGSVTAGSRAADSVELARIAFGGDLQDRTVMTSLINASSPLVWDATMLASAEVYASNNQATMFTPFILAGAMAPSTSAGVCAQTLAEALVGMTFAQLVRPGAPVIFGSFASSMSMQTGAPTFGTPEPALVLYTCAALARRLGVPFRSGGSLTASKVPDAQAAYESAATLLPTIMAGTNFVLHAAGWLEGGLAIGYEKFVLDVDQLGMMATFVKGLDLSDNGQALDAILEHPPGQHFLGTAHTLANFETAFYRSTTADNSSFEQWAEEGSLDSAQRANKVWKRQLADYEPPELDESIDEAMLDFISRRKQELPDEFA